MPFTHSAQSPAYCRQVWSSSGRAFRRGWAAGAGYCAIYSPDTRDLCRPQRGAMRRPDTPGLRVSTPLTLYHATLVPCRAEPCTSTYSCHCKSCTPAGEGSRGRWFWKAQASCSPCSPDALRLCRPRMGCVRRPHMPVFTAQLTRPPSPPRSSRPAAPPQLVHRTRCQHGGHAGK